MNTFFYTNLGNDKKQETTKESLDPGAPFFVGYLEKAFKAFDTTRRRFLISACCPIQLQCHSHFFAARGLMDSSTKSLFALVSKKLRLKSGVRPKVSKILQSHFISDHWTPNETFSAR